MEIPLFFDVIIIFGLAILVLLVCFQIRVPAIVGFLITGILAGPHGLKLISSVHDVEILAEIGVVLLLFTIGLEFSVRDFLRIKKSILLGGSIQVALTIIAVFFIAMKLGFSTGSALFMGFLASLSSTAIVLKEFQEHANLDTPQGRNCLGILIFQDVVVVPMMLVTPLLAGTSSDLGMQLTMLLGKGIIVIFAMVVLSKWIIPFLLYQVARTRNRELFLLVIIVICFGIAGMTYKIGLSLALGAFMAGLIISESEFSHEATSNILPFRDVFTSLFFVSIGMLLNVNTIISQPELILLLTLGILFLKTITASIAVLIMGYPIRIIILTGLAISQVGEFSFILSRYGLDNGLFHEGHYQIFIAVTIITMGASPFLIHISSNIAELFAKLPLPEYFRNQRFSNLQNDITEKKDHLIIVGYGLNGSNLAHAAKRNNIPYVIIELNSDTVRREKKNNEPIFYGDSTNESVLKHANITSARIITLTIQDAAATRRITELARRINSKVHIIARTRFVTEIEPLQELGANEVIPEEFETSLEIFSRVLRKYLVSKNEIDKFVAEVHSNNYGLLMASDEEISTSLGNNLNLPDIDINTFRVEDTSLITGKSLSETEFRKKYGVTVLAIRRENKIISHPGADEIILKDDCLILMGNPDKLANIISLFTNSES